MSMFKWLFSRPSKVKIGTYWTIDTEEPDNPFDQNKKIIKILDKQNGWCKIEKYTKREGKLCETSELASKIYAFYNQIEKPDWLKE